MWFTTHAHACSSLTYVQVHILRFAVLTNYHTSTNLCRCLLPEDFGKCILMKPLSALRFHEGPFVYAILTPVGLWQHSMFLSTTGALWTAAKGVFISFTYPHLMTAVASTLTKIPTPRNVASLITQSWERLCLMKFKVWQWMQLQWMAQLFVYPLWFAIFDFTVFNIAVLNLQFGSSWSSLCQFLIFNLAVGSCWLGNSRSIELYYSENAVFFLLLIS